MRLHLLAIAVFAVAWPYACAGAEEPSVPPQLLGEPAATQEWHPPQPHRPLPDAPRPTSARLREATWGGAASSETALPAVVLENDYLAAVVVPGLGGRLVSFTDKFTRRQLLRGTGLGFGFGADATALARPAAWHMGIDGDSSVSVWVGCTEPESGARWSVEYRLPSDQAALLAIVRLTHGGDRPLPAAWCATVACATARDGQAVGAPAGISPASGDTWAFSGYYDPVSDSGLYAILSAETTAATDVSAGELRLRGRSSPLAPGERRTWALQWVGVSGIGAPEWMSPDQAAARALHPEALELRLSSFRFMNWLRLVVERDGALLFDNPWLLQPRSPSIFLFPLSHPGQRLSCAVDDWMRSRSITRLSVLGEALRTVGGSTEAPQAEREPSEATYTAALELLAGKSAAEGRAVLQNVPFGARYSSAALRLLAVESVRLGDASLAAQLATLSLAAGPENAAALALRAYLHRRLEQRDAAVADLSALLALDPLSPFVETETVFWKQRDSKDVDPATTAELDRLLADEGARRWTAAAYAGWGASREAEWVLDHPREPRPGASPF